MQDFRTPAAPTDLTNKAYVDAQIATVQALANEVTFTPPINWYLSPQSTLGAAAGSPVRGRWTATPFRVGYPGFTADALACWVGTAAVGGAGAHLLAGIYKDDGTGFPDTVSAAVATADFTVLTPSGNKVATFAAPVVLAPGLYWIVTLYDYTTVPTTPPTFNVFNNQTWQLPNPTGPSISSVRGYTNGSGKTALPSATSWLTGAGVSGSNDCPLIYIRRSA